MTTTAQTITTRQIRALCTEAGEAGDHMMAAICDLACDLAGDLGGNWADLLSPSDMARLEAMTQDEARAECARAISAAAAQGK